MGTGGGVFGRAWVGCAMPGVLVVSLDFELYWGVRDRCALQPIMPDLMASRRMVSAMLARFEAHGVRATWATVGMMFFRSRPQLLEALPATRPHYRQPAYDAYAELAGLGPDVGSDSAPRPGPARRETGELAAVTETRRHGPRPTVFPVR